MEQILPSAERITDPRDFYASDSPVLDGDSHSDQDLYKSAEEFPEIFDLDVRDDHQVASSFVRHPVFFSYLTYVTQTGWCKYSQQPQILLNQPSHTTQSSSSRQVLPSHPPPISAALLPCCPTVNQHWDTTSGGNYIPSIACPDVRDFAGSQNNNYRQETHATFSSLSGQDVNNSNHSNMGISSQKIRISRRRSPKRRGARENSLAVSSVSHINSGVVLLF